MKLIVYDILFHTKSPYMPLEWSERAPSGGGIPPNVPDHLASTVGSRAQGALHFDSNGLTIGREIHNVRGFFHELGLSTDGLRLFRFSGTPTELTEEARKKHSHPGAPVGSTYAAYLKNGNTLLVAERSREMMLEVDARERGICRALSSATFSSSVCVDTHLQPYFLEEAFSEWITARYVAKKWGEKMTIAFETVLDGVSAHPESFLKLAITSDDETTLDYSIPLKYIPLEREDNQFFPLLGIQSCFGYILEQMIEINPDLENALMDWRRDTRKIGRVFEIVRKIDPLLEEVLMSGPIPKGFSMSSLPTWQGDTTESIRYIHRLQEILRERRPSTQPSLLQIP